MSERLCDHPGCSCSIEPEEMFCSPWCAASHERPHETEGCHCDHDGCLGAAGEQGDEALSTGFDAPS